jgi:AcrR family transcriptional regulator
MTAETQQNRQKRRKESRPDEILAAALTVFSRDGFSGARLDEIAELAGCTKGTIYVYFPSKEELFKAVVRKLITPQFRQVDGILKDASIPVVMRLKMFIRGGYMAIVTNPTGMGLLRLLVADGPKFPDLVDYYHDQIPRVGHEMIKSTIQEGIDNGELRQMDADAAAHIITGPILAEIMRRLLLAVKLLPLEHLIDTHLDIVFNGLLANPPKKT